MQVRGRHIPGPNGGSFEILDVPKPPEAKLVRERDEENRTIREYFEARVGCPHCHQDISFVFPIKDCTTDFPTQVMQDAQRYISDRYARIAKDHDRRPDVVIAHHLAAMEEWNS